MVVKPYNRGGCAVTVCTPNPVALPVANPHRVQTRVTGGDVSSEGGLVRRRQADRRLKRTIPLAKRLSDPRDPSTGRHPLVTLWRPRLYGFRAPRISLTMTGGARMGHGRR